MVKLLGENNNDRLRVMQLCKSTGWCLIGSFEKLHGTFEYTDEAFCLSVGLTVPCPTLFVADKSLSLMRKSPPTTREAVAAKKDHVY